MVRTFQWNQVENRARLTAQGDHHHRHGHHRQHDDQGGADHDFGGRRSLPGRPGPGRARSRCAGRSRSAGWAARLQSRQRRTCGRRQGGQGVERGLQVAGGRPGTRPGQHAIDPRRAGVDAAHHHHAAELSPEPGVQAGVLGRLARRRRPGRRDRGTPAPVRPRLGAPRAASGARDAQVRSPGYQAAQVRRPDPGQKGAEPSAAVERAAAARASVAASLVREAPRPPAWPTGVERSAFAADGRRGGRGGWGGGRARSPAAEVESRRARRPAAPRSWRRGRASPRTGPPRRRPPRRSRTARPRRRIRAVNRGRLPYAARSRDGARSAGSGAALIAPHKWTNRAPGAIGYALRRGGRVGGVGAGLGGATRAQERGPRWAGAR